MSRRRRSPVVADRQLRMRLRQARSEADKTQNEVAEALDWSPSKILRIENGHVKVTTSDLVALLTQFPQLSQDETAELVALARESRRPTVGSRFRDVLSKEFAEWVEYEAFASEIFQYETKFVPGVLQIESYASAIIQALWGKEIDDQGAERRVTARLERAQGLTALDGPKMSFIVDEGALRRAVGNEYEQVGYTVMIEQLEHLKRMNTAGRLARNERIEPDLNPNISIQVMPYELGAYKALQGPFEILTLEDGGDENMLYLENPGGDVVLRDRLDDIAPYLDMFAEMRQSLAPPARFDDLVDELIELMNQRRNGISVLNRSVPG